MTRFTNLFSTPGREIPKIIPAAFLIFAWLGFLDSAYLTLEHYMGAVPPCSVVSGCEKVLLSPYAELFGVPVALFGALYYFGVLFFTAGYLIAKRVRWLLCAAILPFFGFLGTLWFLYAQAFILRAFCLYCLASAALTGALAVVSLLFFRKVFYNKPR